MSLRRYRLRRTLGVCALLIGTLTEAETVVLDTMDADQAAWGPGRAEMTHVQEGKGALKWAPSEGVLQRDDLCVDLGSFNSLRLWIHAKAATFARIKLTVPVRDGRTFSTVFRIDWRSCRSGAWLSAGGTVQPDGRTHRAFVSSLCNRDSSRRSWSWMVSSSQRSGPGYRSTTTRY